VSGIDIYNTTYFHDQSFCPEHIGV